MSLDLSLFAEHGHELLSGFGLTLLAWVVSCVLAFALGAPLGLLAAAGRRPVRVAIGTYVQFFRGTPLLIQLFLLYYGGPRFGLVLDAWSAGLLGLTLYGGAYATEIVRGGLLSIPPGQMEAAKTLGYSRWQTVRHIVAPQVLVPVIPPLTNNAIFLLKDTALLSVLTVPELTFQVTGLTLETFAFVEPYLALSIGYWLLIEIAARLGRALEGRVNRHLDVRA